MPHSPAPASSPATYRLTLTFRGGSTEDRDYPDVKEARRGFFEHTGNAMVRDALLTSPTGMVLAEHHDDGSKARW